ncbi:SRPBCC family protein [Halomicrobium zhouii]|nr:SRPBCC family protein [Halomicrobium zhouii]
MPVYERSTHVDAPLEDVWEFHSSGDGLEALTPDWLHLRIEEATGPDGQPDPDVLEKGATIVSSVRPFGVGPRQRWTSVIVDRRERDGHALFRDEMVDGPFASWEHTHRFSAEGEGTLVHDRVEYELLGGPVGRVVDPFAVVGFEPMFRYRHRRTRELLG